MRNKMLFFVFLVSALIVLSGQVRAEGYVDGLRAGIAQCQNDPASCGITTSYDTGYNDAKKACEKDPKSCGITPDPGDGSYKVGEDDAKKACEKDPNLCGITPDPKDGSTKACQDTPALCGLHSKEDYDEHYRNAQKACKDSPSTCGIEVTDTNGSTADGIKQCKYDPASCGITVNYDNNGSTEEGIAQCQSNPAYYGITIDPKDGSTPAGIAQCKADTVACGITNDNDFESRKTQFLEKTNGKTDNLLIISDKKILYLPKVVMIDEKGQPTTVSEVYMSYIQPTSNFRNIDLLFQLVEFEMSIDGKVTKFDKNGVPITK